jgi:hypothetical protein
MELDDGAVFKCKECNKKFTTKALLVRHQTSFTHTKGIPCHLCAKHYSRSDDLSTHLQTKHQYAFKHAGRKAGALRAKAKRRSRDEDNVMAKAIEKQLQSGVNKTKNKLVSNARTRPYNIESTTRLVNNTEVRFNVIQSSPIVAKSKRPKTLSPEVDITEVEIHSDPPEASRPVSSMSVTATSTELVVLNIEEGDSVGPLLNIPSWESWENLINNTTQDLEFVPVANITVPSPSDWTSPFSPFTTGLPTTPTPSGTNLAESGTSAHTEILDTPSTQLAKNNIKGGASTDYTTEWDTLNFLLKAGSNNDNNVLSSTTPALSSSQSTIPYLYSPAASEAIDMLPEDNVGEMTSSTSSNITNKTEYVDNATLGTTSYQSSPTSCTADHAVYTTTDNPTTSMYCDDMEVEVTTSDPTETDTSLEPIPKRWIIVEEMWLGLYNTDEELAAEYAEAFIEQLKRA